MIPFGTYPHTHARPIGPEHRLPFMGTTLMHFGPVQIGWLYVGADGWATRVEVTDPTWLDLADLPRKRLRGAW